MSADLYFTTDSSFFLLLSLFFRHLISERAERNLKCNFKKACPKSGVSPPLQIEGPKTTFSDDFDHNLMATLTAYIFGMGQRVDIVSKQHELRSTNGFELRICKNVFTFIIFLQKTLFNVLARDAFVRSNESSRYCYAVRPSLRVTRLSPLGLTCTLNWWLGLING